MGPQTFVPLTWICKKQTAVSHSSSEAEIIALDAGFRLEGLPALQLWEIVIEVFQHHSDNKEKAKKNKAHVSDTKVSAKKKREKMCPKVTKMDTQTLKDLADLLRCRLQNDDRSSPQRRSCSEDSASPKRRGAVAGS